ncbi:MAG: 50S ribosomal protein L3 [Candidatus Nitrosopolaris sp.]
MGHRKYSAPRRGSIAFRPRARAKSIESRLRNWPQIEEKSNLSGFAGFKAGMIHVLTIDDREKTPNFGKHFLNPSTVIVTPPVKIIGIRAYFEDQYGKHAVFDVYSKDLPKYLPRKFTATKSDEEKLVNSESKLDKAVSVVAVVAVLPRDANLSQKKPFVFEIAVTGKDVKSRFDYLKSILGKEIRVSDVFQVGQYIDVSAITRGKGVEGPITRFGVKRKQHKSRKSVRAVGTLGPISPAVVMYTVPRQGQRGFHQRTEYNKRILMMSNIEKNTGDSVNPNGGFKHFGLVRGDYIIVKGSIAGVPKRLIKMRQPMRSYQKKILEPKILEVVVQ